MTRLDEIIAQNILRGMITQYEAATINAAIISTLDRLSSAEYKQNFVLEYGAKVTRELTYLTLDKND